MINKNKPYQQTNDEKETALFIGVAFVLVCVVGVSFNMGFWVGSFCCNCQLVTYQQQMEARPVQGDYTQTVTSL